MVSSGNYEKIGWAVGAAWIISAFTIKWVGMLPYFVLAGFWGIIIILQAQQKKLEEIIKQAPVIQPSQISLPEFVNNLEHY